MTELTKDDIAALVKLQQIDLETGRIKAFLRDLPLQINNLDQKLEEFTRRLKPDMVGSGIKEKYSYHKLGVPFRQMHSWDYSGPYHGFDGFPVFARDMDMTVNSPTWSLIRRKKP